MKLKLLTQVVFWLCMLPLASPAQIAKKKMIQVGWDQPTTAYLREHHVRMETETPFFDGVLFGFGVRSPQGQWVDGHTVLTRVPFQREWLEAAVADIKACRFVKFTDNFVRIDTHPGDLDFANDHDWATAATNMGHAAWFTKSAGIKGIFFDSECYAANQWDYDPGTGRSFEQEAALTRQRGRQVMEAMARENPDLVIQHFWGPVTALSQGRAENPTEVLPADGRALLIYFFAGLLDAIPPTMTMVEGNQHAYYLENEAAALRYSHEVKSASGPTIRLLPPEVRGKYLKNVQAGLGIYLDAYVFKSDFFWHIGDKDGLSKIERLRDNVGWALEAADEYIWIYGENGRWASRFSDQDYKTERGDKVGLEHSLNATKNALPWEETLPGITEALAMAHDPLGSALREIETTKAENLVVNPTFDPKAEGIVPSAPAQPDWQAGQIPGWTFWQSDNSKGSWGAVEGGVEIKGMREGCLIQITQFQVTPGERFVVTARGRSTGGLPFVTVGWRGEAGQWIFQPRYTLSFSRPLPDGTKQAVGVIQVPDQARYLMLMPSASFQTPEQSAVFSNLGVYRWNDLMKIEP